LVIAADSLHNLTINQAPRISPAKLSPIGGVENGRSVAKEQNIAEARTRELFRNGDGPYVLAEILRGACRFFGRIEGDNIAADELYIRQQVGREILWSLGVMPGPYIDMQPEYFVRKLINAKEKEPERRRFWRKEKK